MTSTLKAVKAETFSSLDLADHLETNEEVTDFLALLLAEGTPAEITAGLGVVARTKGMAKIASAAGVSRESLYRTLSENGNPEFGTIINVFRAMGMKLVPVPAAA